MTNKQISEIFNDIYIGFWIKWRDRVSSDNEDQWEEILRDVQALADKYGTQNIEQLIFWFLNEFETRMKERGEINC